MFNGKYSVCRVGIYGEIRQERVGDKLIFARSNLGRRIEILGNTLVSNGYLGNLDELLDDLGIMSRINTEEVIDLL